MYRELKVPKELCNFYQSRVKQLDVSDIHYDDITRRADEYYPRILEALRETSKYCGSKQECPID